MVSMTGIYPVIPLKLLLYWKMWILCNLSPLVMNVWDIKILFSFSFGWCHDDVIKWKHFPRYCPFVRGIHRSPVNSPHKGQWRGALIFSLICDWINRWVNNREAGDLRCHRTHYGVLVMKDLWTTCWDLLKLYYEWLSMYNASILSKILRNYLF